MAESSDDGLLILSRAECLRLLQPGGVGCIGLPDRGAPLLRPVNFALQGDALVIRTGHGRIMEAAQRTDPASLESQAIDPLEHTGWSVIVTGKLAELPTDAVTLGLPLRAWASGRKDRFVALTLDEVSGLRIPAGRGNR
jgi:nitroimidazol reductase NimA-like FMN-containing flavoprotein (pyridoxamine 5'-phosphate oxidase superfamily)